MRIESLKKLFGLQRDRRVLGWLLDAWRGCRAQALLNAALGVAGVCAGLLFVWGTKLAIDIATHVEPRIPLHTAIALLIGIIAVQLAIGTASRWVKALLGVRAQNRMRQRLFGNLLSSRWHELRAYHTGDLLNRIEQDVAAVVSFLAESLPALLATCVQFAGAFVFLYLMDRRLAVLVVALIPLFLICSKIYTRKMRRLTHDVRDEESRVQAVIQESLQHALVVKTLECVATLVGRLGRLQGDLHAKVLRRTRYATVSALIMNAGFATGYLTTFIWGVGSLEEGLITYGTLIAFVQLVGQIQEPVRAFSRFVPAFISAITSAERLAALDAIPREARRPASAVLPALGGAVGVRFDAVRFAYTADDSRRPVLDGLSFDFSPGTVTAVIGETGAGKTTLVRLILALIAPQGGTVSLYDTEGHRLEACPDTRAYLTYVPQGNTLLSGTIRDNLRLGDPAATDAEMRDALHAAAAGFVDSLPLGLDTRCGEMGDGLSEGQAQRIAIARALLRRRPILLLDEATSSLDSETERTVLRNIIDLNPGRTVIFVTHRPEVLRHSTRQLRMVKR